MSSWLPSWLRLDAEPDAATRDALTELIAALERHEPERARHLARFAYLLGRVAHADQHVSAEEIAVMEQLVSREGHLPPDQATLVVALAKNSTRLFGGSDDFIVARDFARDATYEQRLDLVRCLFAVSAAESSISIAEEREIQRIARELRIEPADIVRLRLEHQQHLPGLTRRSNA
jgi:uncharacterized tellurite resistance protein B-like protein